MKNINLILVLVSITFAAEVFSQTFTYDFTTGYDGWSGDFADYPVADSVAYELEFIRTTLPAPLDTEKFALKISGNNHSDDLFMFIKRKISGLLPHTQYLLLIEVEFASNAPTNAVGIGGAPGEGVTVKAGSTIVEPMKINMGGDYVMNIDKGNQAMGGADMDTIGHIGVSDTTTVFTLISRSNATHLFTITTDANGEAWVCIGTDSGFEGTTTLYYNSISLTFTTTTGSEDIAQSDKVTVYPNPATHMITVISAKKITSIELYTPAGELLYRISYPDPLASSTIDLSGFQKGPFLIKVSCGEQSYSQKIIVQ